MSLAMFKGSPHRINYGSKKNKKAEEDMNRRTRIFLSTVFALLCLVTGRMAVAGAVDAGASAAVESYLNFLIAGDIDGLKSLLSPNLLGQKESILNSPSYDATLRARYQNATFKILDPSPAADGRIKVDTRITLDGDHPMEASFILITDASGNYLIDEEVQ
jgi:hypothetical protein